MRLWRALASDIIRRGSAHPCGPARPGSPEREEQASGSTIEFCAVTARYNPNIQAIYRRLKDQGKPNKVARTAAARKLLLLAHAIYESGEPFRAPAEEVT